MVIGVEDLVWDECWEVHFLSIDCVYFFVDDLLDFVKDS